MQGEGTKITANEMQDIAGVDPTLAVTDVQATALTTAPVVETDPAMPRQQQRPGWFVLPAEELPRPTYWPVIMALAITLICFGVVTTVLISIIGLVLFFISLIGWIGDLRNEQHGEH